MLFHFNHYLLALLFRLFPFTDPRMNLAEFFIENRLASGFIFAVSIFYFWILRDEKTTERRARIIEASLACLAAVVITLAVRPFVGMLSPARNPDFRQLYPPYLWNMGSGNSFPSHSTLVYFVMAAGLWPLQRKWSIALCIWTLLAVSLPRVYIGGHYPTDVIASMIIAIAALCLTWSLGRSAAATKFLNHLSGNIWFELLVFLWLFELGESFRSSGEIAIWFAHRVLHVI